MVGERSQPVIVVGVDGSEASKEALRWAARQAELTGAELHPVMAWRLPATYSFPANYSDVDFAGDARRELQRIIDEVLGMESGVRVVPEVSEGHAAEVLIEAAKQAELLVVGSHGRGAFSGMLLGSVSQHCVHHASCPVLVVRTADH